MPLQQWRHAPTEDHVKTLNLPTLSMQELTQAMQEPTQPSSALDQACFEYGAFRLTDHALEGQASEALLGAIAEFFAQPLVLKRQLSRCDQNPWGFYDRALTRNTLDCKEIFDVGPQEGNMIPQWPENIAGFRAAVEASTVP
jgi:isopenicillin N synthase-like dioxygenase